MKQIFILSALSLVALAGCVKTKKLEEKGFSVSPVHNSGEENNLQDIKSDTLFETQPSSVLLTGVSKIRLTTIYKVNHDHKTGERFVGSNNYHTNYSEEGETNGNQWHYNLVPGFEAVYGYNLVNVSHFNTELKTNKMLFPKPVLIKTIYYPSFTNDTLYHKPINRNYILISAYDEDTNKDGFINIKDLRRFYHFDINGDTKTALIPQDYSAFKSEYDSGNDCMYIFAKHDENKDGFIQINEPIHIFMLDLKTVALTMMY